MQSLKRYRATRRYSFSDRTRVVACSGCSGIFDFALFGDQVTVSRGAPFLSAKRKRRTSASPMSDKHTAVVNKATRSLTNATKRFTSTLQQVTKLILRVTN